jgi:hypothetical protein
MRNLVIMPAMAQNRERMNLGEYAEEATIIVDEPVRDLPNISLKPTHRKRLCSI